MAWLLVTPTHTRRRKAAGYYCVGSVGGVAIRSHCFPPYSLTPTSGNSLSQGPTDTGTWITTLLQVRPTGLQSSGVHYLLNEPYTETQHIFRHRLNRTRKPSLRLNFCPSRLMSLLKLHSRYNNISEYFGVKWELPTLVLSGYSTPLLLQYHLRALYWYRR